MKKLITGLLFILAVSISASANPWHEKTKHKTVKRMKPSQIRKIQIGYTMYERNPATHKVEKNLNRPWSTVKRPTSYNAFHNNKKDKRNPMFYGKGK
jgi:hypothetical protein